MAADATGGTTGPHGSLEVPQQERMPHCGLRVLGNKFMTNSFANAVALGGGAVKLSLTETGGQSPVIRSFWCLCE